MSRSTVRTSRTIRTIRTTRTILAIVGLAALGLALVRFATSATGSPPLLHPRLVDDWWAAGDPLDAAAALARLVCLVLLGYLLLVSAVRLLSMRVGWTGLASATTRLLPRVVVVMTTTLVASTTVAYAATGDGAGGSRGSGARMEVVETSGQVRSTTTSTSTTSSTVAAVTSTNSSTVPPTTVEAPPPPPRPAQIGEVSDAPADAPARTSLPWATAAGNPPVEAVHGNGGQPKPPTPTLGAADAATYVVQSGDHLWAIAEQALAERMVAEQLGDPPTEAQVTTYWSALIELNRDRLVDPANPDLILVGQEFVLPAG